LAGRRQFDLDDPFLFVDDVHVASEIVRLAGDTEFGSVLLFFEEILSAVDTSLFFVGNNHHRD
jgi:hypothetical protein